MARKPRTVHVAKITNTHKGKTYTSYYLRRTFRQDGKVKKGYEREDFEETWSRYL